MNTTMPLITVGVPVYNGEKYLERAICSLQEQNYPNFEIVISDNCSRDATAGICRQLGANDKRIRYYANQKNIGAVANFVETFHLARGEFFMWAAYDDLWDPSCLSYLAEELIAEPEVGLAHSGVVLLDDSGRTVAEKYFAENDNPNYWSCTSTAFHCVRPARGAPKLSLAMYGLFRTEFLGRAIPYVRDVAMWDRLFVVLVAMIAPFRYCPKPLYKRTIQGNRANERYPTDSYSRQISASRWWRAHTVRNLAAMLLFCPNIPKNRKIVIPFIVFRFAWGHFRLILHRRRKQMSVFKGRKIN